MENLTESKGYLAALYVRLSKEDSRKEESNSIINQKDFIRNFLADKPDILICTEYVDDGYSGVNFDRPAFQRMMQDIAEHKINCIVVKDLSRFGRNYIEVGRYIEQIFPLLGIRFIAINDNYDSADKTAISNHMILPFKNLINDAYCRDISIKIRSHLEIKRKQGEFVGAFPIYGYRKGADKNKLFLDTYAAEIVKEIFRMKINGMSQQMIADELNHLHILSPAEYKKEQGSHYKAVFQIYSKAKWTAIAVSRILSNEVYTGTLVQGKESTPNHKIKVRIKKQQEQWIRVENTHEAVISRADFEIVSEIMKRDTRILKGKNGVSPYSGYLFCADCGSSMVRKKIKNGSTQYVYYICSGNKKDKRICSSHRINELALHDTITKTIQLQWKIWTTFQETMESFREITDYSSQEKVLEMQSEKMKKELEKYGYLILESYIDYKNGILTQEEYVLFKKELEARQQEAKKTVFEIEKKKAKLLKDRINKKHQMEVNHSMLVRFINGIYIYDNHRIQIIFRFQDRK